MTENSEDKTKLTEEELGRVTGGAAIPGAVTVVICRDCRGKLKIDIKTRQVITSCPCGHNHYVMYR